MIGMDSDEGYFLEQNYWQNDKRDERPIDRAMRKRVPITSIFYTKARYLEERDAKQEETNNK